MILLLFYTVAFVLAVQDARAILAALILLYLDVNNTAFAGDFILDYTVSLDRTPFNDSDEGVVNNKRY